MCHAMSKPDWTPTRGTELVDWCTSNDGSTLGKKDVWAIFLLVMWELWNYRNAIVFDGATPSVAYVIGWK